MTIKKLKLEQLSISIATVGDGNFKDDLIEHKSLCCNKSSRQKFDGKLKELF